MKIVYIIPARYGSTRFPGKPLALVQGKPMIQRVVEQVGLLPDADEIVVATDDVRIADVVRGFGGQVVMTGSHHISGTDRCAEAYRLLSSDVDVVVNVQGDEPFIHPEALQSLCAVFSDPKVEIATLCKRIDDPESIQNPNVVKVVSSIHGKALYFSRYPIPYQRQAETTALHYKHLGIYAYRPAVLQKLATLTPTPLEQTESLEQLRWLENGYHIQLVATNHESTGIDTPEDLEKVNQLGG
jgi:3-deoxy-manno-octulosonate cytidylyltransferase (CMP-KDO synthetase)